jgi:Rrf2 family protein
MAGHVGAMNHFGVGVEYALHILTQLARFEPERPPSARALADFQGVPAAYLAKVLTSLQKAAIVIAAEGKGGGYRLARAPDSITFLDVVDAVEGQKPLFQCTEIRQRCVLYGGNPPAGVTKTVCAIHAVMLAAEKQMRQKLATVTVADIAAPLAATTTRELKEAAVAWFAARVTPAASRRRGRGARRSS